MDKIISVQYPGKQLLFIRLSGLYPYNGLGMLSLAQLIIYCGILFFSIFIFVQTAIHATGDLTLTIQAIEISIIILLTVIILIIAVTQRNRFNQIHMIMAANGSDYNDNHKPEELYRIKNEAFIQKNKVISYSTMVFVVVVVTTIVGSLAEILIVHERKEIQDIDTRLPMPLWHPFSYEEPVIFHILLIYEVLLCILVGIIIFSGDIIMFSVNFNLLLQFKILQRSLEALPERAEQLYQNLYLSSRNDNSENEKILENINRKPNQDRLKSCYLNRLKQNIEYHLELEKAFNHLNLAMRYITGFIIITGSVVIAMSLLAFVMDDSNYFAYLISISCIFCELLGIGIFCYFGQEISDQHTEIQQVLYRMDWISLPKEVTMYIKIIMEKTKRPLVLKAGGIWPLNLEFFVSILNNTYSYFNFILVTKNKLY